MGWAEVEQFALEFLPLVLKYPEIFQELQGVSQGSGNNLATIMALNARTEIMYGMMDDGCTALAWKTENGNSFLAQNWDWQVEQKENLVVLDVVPGLGKPRYKMVTEAGIIGKIGLNELGVGGCLNAIRARGVNVDKMPVHIGLKFVLESRSKDEAVKKLETLGIGSACTIVIADTTGGVALECSANDIKKVEMDENGRIFHTNHFLRDQEGVVDTQMPKDTLQRVGRIEALADNLEGEPNIETISELFKDEQNFPTSICRAKGGESNGATLFNIVSDLKKREALVSLGRPVKPDEQTWLRFN
jgi:isopenicillin-N N-acyltransferase-like protein